VEEPLTAFDLEATSERIGELLNRFELGADADVSRDVTELLQHIDALHREALLRLLALAREADPGLDRVRADHVLSMVLPLYDLLPEGSGAGGAWRALQGDIIPLRQVRAPALQRPSSPVPAGLPVSPLVPAPRPLRAPVFVPVAPLETLDEGRMRRLDVAGTQVLLCRIGGDPYAFRNICPGSALPLDLGTLEGTAIVCPWHQCRFDARSGRRLDNDGPSLEVIPVSVVDGEIRLALGVAPVGR